MASKKYTALCIYQILKEYSDEDHPLLQKDIIDLLEKNYDIKIERKSIGSIINEMMNDSVFSDYDIQKVNKKGVYLGERLIEKEEMTYLIDALITSKTLTAKQASDIIKKISKEFSNNQRTNSFKQICKCEDVNRTRNVSVLTTIDILSDAIKHNREIKFNYTKYLLDGSKSYKEYTVSPYFLINNQGGYYLISFYDKHPDDLSHFRVDEIEGVEILHSRSREIRSIPKYSSGFDKAKYANARPYMFSGKEIKAKIKLLKDHALSYVVDWFGYQKPIYIDSNYYVILDKVNENALIYWCLQYCDYLELVEPHSTREKIKEKLTSTLQNYK